jgi:hypothetical protein
VARPTEEKRLTPQRRYLELLDASSIADLEERIVDDIQSAVTTKSGEELPVRLSRIAQLFSVDPKPLFDTKIPLGQISYDPEIGNFVIRLGLSEFERSHRNKGDTLYEEVMSAQDDPIMTRRLRFTYAHELAHRFLFVRQNDAWVRAVEAACRAKRATAAAAEIRRLKTVEEQLCDRIAGRLLVPPDRLKAHLEKRFATGGTIDFADTVEQLADKFAVSRECMLVQIQRALRKGVLSSPGEFCALLIRESRRKGTGSIGYKKLRVEVSIMPPQIQDGEASPWFPGIAVEELGKEFLEFVQSVQSNPDRMSGDIRLQVKILKKAVSRDEERKAFLDGWWRSSGRKTRYSSAPILIWGKLQYS